MQLATELATPVANPAPMTVQVPMQVPMQVPAPVPTQMLAPDAAQAPSQTPMQTSAQAPSAAPLAGPGQAPGADTPTPYPPPAEAMPAAQLPAATDAMAQFEARTASDSSSDEDLWSRIRRGFKMPDLEGRRAQSSTRWYAGQPEYISRMAGRASMYLYHIVEEIEKRGMPTEIALLPFVESAMQPEAVSVAKAAGLWQFIPSTGKLYSLEQNLWKDERLGVIESTRAALDYLQNLYAEFGDWQLALAAYNCGEAAVEKALARARAAHRSVAYSDLRLPVETQFYVPKLQAIKNIVADPQRFGISLPSIPNQPYFIAFNKTQDMDVTTAARLADIPVDEFRMLNPAFNRPVIVGASSPTILVPADHAETFDANLAAWQATGQPLSSWTAYTLQPGEQLAQVAKRLGLTESQLREANHIPPRYRATAGSTILVPRNEAITGDIGASFMSASLSLVPENGNLRQVTYRVRRGDTLATVARRWHVSGEDIIAWNGLHSENLLVGQRLTLTLGRPAPAATHGSPHARPASAAPTTPKAAPATHAAAAAAAVPSRM